MADQKSWLWRKKPSEKTIVAADNVDLTSKENEEEIRVLVAEKTELEKDLKNLNNKLHSAIAECNLKDEHAKKQAKTAQEALAGWEKAEAKALALKQELDESLRQREANEDRIHHLDAALKECMQQLRFVRDDQEQRIHDVLFKASEELEETKMFFEEKLAESSKKITKLIAENSQLKEVIFLKDQLIEDLDHQRVNLECDLKAMFGKMESMEKDNNSLRYELRILEKEVDIRNEEREFNRRAADAAHKQHLENVKKIAKLESECQRLRVLVRKRLPGPAAVAKMKREVNVLQRDLMGNRRNKSNSNHNNSQLGDKEDSHLESPSKRVNLLTERVCILEEENNALRENLQKKISEFQIARSIYARAALKSSQVDTHLEESPKGQINGDIRRLHGGSLASMSDIGSDDKISCAGSWASAQISETDQFRDGKDKVSPPKSVGKMKINHFMDDFLEMEKLALVCVDKPFQDSSITKDNGSHSSSPSETIGNELVPVPSKLSILLLKLIKIVEGIKLQSQDCNTLQTSSGKNGAYLTPNNLKTPGGYLARVVQWESSELTDILHNFLHTCDDLLHGRAEFETFIQELTSSLEWILNHCFSLKDVSSMKNEIRRQLNFDDAKSEGEIEEGLLGICQLSETESGKIKDSNRSMKHVKQELELLSGAHDNESFRSQLQKAETTIANLQAELKTLIETKSMIENQFENDRMMIEDLNSQLKSVKSELDETHQKFTSLEVMLKNKTEHCEGLESKCQDLQSQLERVTTVDNTEHDNMDGAPLRTDLEISAASEKLAECQETIFHLGKQLRALTSSHEAVVSDKFIPAPSHPNTITNHVTTNPTPTPIPTDEKKLTNQRSSLFDQMQAEDYAETGQLESPKTKEIICSKDVNSEPTKEHTTEDALKNGNDTAIGALAIVPSKKSHTTSGGLFKKFWRRRKKGSNKKMAVPFAT